MSAEESVDALNVVNDDYIGLYDIREKQLEDYLKDAVSSANDQLAHAQYLSLSLGLWEVAFTQTLNASPLSQTNVDKLNQYFGNLINQELALITKDSPQRNWGAARLLTLVRFYYETAHMASLGALDTRVRLPGALSLFKAALAAEDKTWRALSKAYGVDVPWLEKSATSAPTTSLHFDAQYALDGVNLALASSTFKPPCYVCLGPNRNLSGKLLSYCIVLLLKDRQAINIMSLPMVAQYDLKDGTWHELTTGSTLGRQITVPDPMIPVCGQK